MWNRAFNFLAPFGYEDEAGFHYGEMPRPHDSQQSTQIR
jgi:hypothetical protein